MMDVGEGHVDVLLHDAPVHQLLDTNAYSALVDIENHASASVVVLVGHALVNGGVNLDINIVASLEGSKVGGCVASTIGAESLLEQSARSCAVTVRVGHF